MIISGMEWEKTGGYGINNYGLSITEKEGVGVTVIKLIEDEREREKYYEHVDIH